LGNILGDFFTSSSGTYLCYDFRNIFAKKIGEKIGVFTQTTASFSKNWIITMVFEKNAIFPPKIGKNRRKL
jgi:hypothetical protein